jgi:hypothetical protein
MNNIRRSTVEKLIFARDDYEERNHPRNPQLDEMVRDNLIKLLIESNRVADLDTMRWCTEQLERERMPRSLRRAMELVPSGILDTHDRHANPATLSMRRPSANPDSALSALSVHNWSPNPDIPVQRHLFPVAAQAPNPFNRNAPEFVNPLQRGVDAPDFVPNPHANRICNNCNQRGHVRRNCPNPSVPGRRSGGSTRRHRNNKNNSIRRRKH